jgi:hypothetical protein
MSEHTQKKDQNPAKGTSYLYMLEDGFRHVDPPHEHGIVLIDTHGYKKHKRNVDFLLGRSDGD